MHQKLLVSKYTALIQLIYGQLTRAVSIYARSEENKYIQKKDIPLSKGKSEIKISYISGVALQLSKSHNSQAMNVASSIASHLSANCSDDFLVEVLPPGLIEMEVSDLVLVAWLQRFVDSWRGKSIDFNSSALKAGCVKAVMSEKSDSVFSIQYVHARCCSLLRLAQHEKLIDTNNFSSESIPWFNSYGILCLNHQAERRLINCLVKLVDELEPAIARSLKWEGAALSLVKAFESFWSTCRIYGTLTTTPELAVARLGLVMATQSVLKFLLEEKLDISACSEL